MTWMVHTGSRYHTQDTGYYCGAAAAMMILAEIGISYNNLDQDDLYNSNHAHNTQTGWYTDPNGLKYTLNNRRPAGHLNFVVYKPTSEAEGTRKIVHTLHKYEVSPAVLVFGCMHWIVVPGVQTDVEPVSNATYNVDGFWIHNPQWHSPSPPPPHNATDTCGTGGTLGTSNEFVTYTNWQDTYFTGCDYDNAQGLDQYISVCDPEPPTIKLPLHQPMEFLTYGRRLIKKDEARKFSEMGIKKYLPEDKRVNTALRRTEPGEPFPVMRLDRPNNFYYLLPYENTNGTKMTTQVDARFGTFMGLKLKEEQTKISREQFYHDDAIVERLEKRRYQLPESRIMLNMIPEAVSRYPLLVWQPCQESYSPHLPFHMYTIGKEQIFVRIDGEVFTDLTIGLKGD